MYDVQEMVVIICTNNNSTNITVVRSDNKVLFHISLPKIVSESIGKSKDNNQAPISNRLPRTEEDYVIGLKPRSMPPYRKFLSKRSAWLWGTVHFKHQGRAIEANDIRPLQSAGSNQGVHRCISLWTWSCTDAEE